MPVRTAYAGAAVAGEVLTAANVNKIPGGWIGYGEVTANQGSIGASVADITGLSVAVTVGTSRRLKITAVVGANSTVANDHVILYIQEGATALGQTNSVLLGSAAQNYPAAASVVLTPTSGAHTYKLTLQRVTGSGTVTMVANASAPAFILVEDIGPAT